MYWQPFFIALKGLRINLKGIIMGKLKESIIVEQENHNEVIDLTIDYQKIIDCLIEGATAFSMLSNHCPVDEKHYFLDKRNQLTNCAAVLTSLL
jgi:hypothetical protein